MLTFSKVISIIFITACVILLDQVESKSIYGIGERIIGDQLLLKDVLTAPVPALGEPPAINFNYAIPEQVTLIEIVSDQNVQAEVKLSYHDDLVKGTVTQINATRDLLLPEPFEVLITIYGFNETMLNAESYILNRDQQFHGMFEASEIDDESDYDYEEYVSIPSDHSNAFDGTTHTNSVLEDNNAAEVDDDGDDDDDDGHAGGNDGIDDDSFEHKDKIIEIGNRQKDDYLIYETYQTSPVVTEQRTNHSIVFYYIDSDFITYVKFIIFDHYEDKTVTDSQYIAPLAEYSHYTPNTLKAIITDQQATTLFVQMSLYGFKPADLPVDYRAYMANWTRGDAAGGRMTESPFSTMSPMQRLRAAMQAERRATEATPSLSAHEVAGAQQDNADADAGDDDDEDDDDVHNETFKALCAELGRTGAASRPAALWCVTATLIPLLGLLAGRRQNLFAF